MSDELDDAKDAVIRASAFQAELDAAGLGRPKSDVHAVLAALEAGEWIALEEEVTFTCSQAHSTLVFHPNGHKQTVRRLVRLAEPLVPRETEG